MHPFTAETAHNHSLHNTFTRTGKRFFAPTFAAIFIALCMVFVQQTQASTAAQLVTQINSYGLGGGTGTPLSASASGNTVTVTGNVTNATAELTLNIDANVTVKWQATISNITTGDPR